MKNLKFVSVSFFVLLFSTLTWAQNPTDFFNQGTQAYLSKDYKKAQEFFSQALDLDPHNAVVLTNLALSEFQIGQKPKAIGLLRKALTFDPELNTARDTLNFILTESPVKEIPRTLSFYETWRSRVLEPVPLPVYLFLSVLALFAAGWTLISYIGRRKKALQEEKALPPFPVIATTLAFGCVLFTSLVLMKFYDSTISRGTIISETAPLQTAPGDNQVAILDLPGGAEIIVRAEQGDWAQVTYPGSATGWIKKSSVLMTR